MRNCDFMHLVANHQWGDFTEPQPEFTFRGLGPSSGKGKLHGLSVKEDNAILYLKLAFKATIFFLWSFKKLNWGWLAHLVRIALLKPQMKNFTRSWMTLPEELHTDCLLELLLVVNWVTLKTNQQIFPDCMRPGVRAHNNTFSFSQGGMRTRKETRVKCQMNSV